MKPLKNLNNIEKGKLLADLFPEQLENICKQILKQAEYYLENEEQFTKEWTGFISASFWYNLVRNAQRRIKECGSTLYKNKGWFRDQLFDGYDALFAICCLIEYAFTQECNYHLRHCIYMLFGDEKLVKLTKTNSHG